MVDLVHGHKVILAGVSPVFRSQFFGLSDKKALAGHQVEEVAITGTSIEAFRLFVSLLYRKSIDLSNVRSFKTLFEVK